MMYSASTNGIKNKWIGYENETNALEASKLPTIGITPVSIRLCNIRMKTQ